jgi:hypothetical protein
MGPISRTRCDPSPIANMTEMSEPHPNRLDERDGNRARSRRSPSLAYRLHERWRSMGPAVFSLLLIGCVIPPSLSADNQDAGLNSPPAITSVHSDQVELSEPGPVTQARGTGELVVSMIDTDIGDTLFVRVYVNYTISNPTAARASCTAAPNQSAKRSCTADLRGLCLEGDVHPEPLDMSVLVFDRELLDMDIPAFQAMPPDGLTTGRFYHLICVEP